ncbi:MAG: hypothetical protein RI989_569 [Bacteroidota bacterium]
MKMKSRCLFFFLFGLKGITLFAQDENSALVEQRIEIVSSFLEDGDEVDYSSLLEDLNFYARHPLDLNHVDVIELQSLCVLTDFQIQ